MSFNPARLRVWRGFCSPAAKAEPRCQFSQWTFAGPLGNGRNARIPALPALALERGTSAHRRHPTGNRARDFFKLHSAITLA